MDYRNAEISNGQIFAGGDNKPFSGHLTNLPEQQIRNSRNGLAQVMQVVGLGNQNFHGNSSAVLCDVDVKNGYPHLQNSRQHQKPRSRWTTQIA
ncbi:hypothetical protein [Caballeronia udeis]|uniref:hypothetical protein n=1 Tax=Caballeronia udeis TaxID=1232866 RepID=UPI0007804E00|nr:hypothetical protein [Caballeronia udeis]